MSWHKSMWMRFFPAVRVCLLAMVVPAVLAGGGQADETAAKAAIKSYLKEQTRHSGTLDLYDDKTDAVRNLRATRKEWEARKTAAGYAGDVTFRDVNTGDIVILEFGVSAAADKVGKTTIKSVEPPKGAARAASGDSTPAQFSDDQVQAFMRKYLDEQSKFTGHVALFDPEKEKMRKLELIELDPEVRRMGKFAISRGTFKDLDSEAVLGIDLTTEPKGRSLSMQSLRIRER